MEKGRRSHEHGHKGHTKHDQHIGGSGKSHISDAVRHLEHQHPEHHMAHHQKAPQDMHHYDPKMEGSGGRHETESSRGWPGIDVKKEKGKPGFPD